jgi:hypothetical protein
VQPRFGAARWPVGHGGSVNKGAQGKRAAECLLAHREQPGREEGVPSEFEEVGLNIDLGQPEQALPDLG